MRCVLVFIILFLVGCDKDLPINYPEGIKLEDYKSKNNCNLSACSVDRITRYKAEGQVVEYSDPNKLYVSYGIDAFAILLLCEELEGFQPRDKAKVWGELKDACGIEDTINHFDGIYVLHIDRIEKL